jgi:hypothetical protein
MGTPQYPALYQINTRVYLGEIGRALGRAATLDDVPDADLDEIVHRGFDWVWLLGVWQTGFASREVSRTNAGLRPELLRILPDLREDDICGSCFAITGYTVHTALGGDAALARLRQRLQDRGLRLMLDFVPNHTALDHPWVAEHPEYYVAGTVEDLARAPQNYTHVTPLLSSPLQRGRGLILAHGRDPYFPGWSDTLQLNYGNTELQEAMRAEVLKIAGQCDGVRCDMAMLLLPDVFARTWGIEAPPFWPETIQRTRTTYPDFTFMAEVYWDLEWMLQQQGFAYTYDKRLYDRLRDQHAGPVRDHLRADLEFQEKSARFLENHDEPRAAATFPPGVHQAAAMVTFFTPGLRFLYQGQIEGRRTFLSVHICRAPDEPIDADLQKFYTQLLACLRQPAVRDGTWHLLECAPAWEGNWTWESFVASSWRGQDGQRLLVAVNYAPHQAQCYVRLPDGDDLRGRSFRLDDLMGPASYARDGDDLAAHGLYLDLPPWGYYVFRVTPG